MPDDSNSRREKSAVMNATSSFPSKSYQAVQKFCTKTIETSGMLAGFSLYCCRHE